MQKSCCSRSAAMSALLGSWTSHQAIIHVSNKKSQTPELKPVFLFIQDNQYQMSYQLVIVT